MSFFDFCEAFCRMVDAWALPSKDHLDDFFEIFYRRLKESPEAAFAQKHPHIAYYFKMPPSEVMENMAPWHGTMLKTEEEKEIEEAEDAGLPNPFTRRRAYVSLTGMTAVSPKWEWRRRPVDESIPDAMIVIMESLSLVYMQRSTTEMKGTTMEISKELARQLNREAKGVTVGVYE